MQDDRFAWPADDTHCDECGYDYSWHRERLTARCANFPGTLEGLLLSADPDLVRRRRLPKIWSAIEYAAHVAEAIRWYVDRIRRVLNEELPLLTPFDFDTAAEIGEYHRLTVHEVVPDLRAACATLADLANSLAASDLARRGLGSDGSPRTVAGLLSRAEHELVHHELDVRRSLRLC